MPDLAEQIRGFIDSGATPVTAQEVVGAHRSSMSPTYGRTRYHRPSRPRRMNTYAIGAAAMATAICVLVVVLVFGFGVASSSKTPVVTPARPAFVPAPWQKVTFGGLSMYAPGNWPVRSETTYVGCGYDLDQNGVVLNTGANVAPPSGCPFATLPPHFTQAGLFVDPGQYGPLTGVKGLNKCIRVNGLSTCPIPSNELGDTVQHGGTLVLSVSIPGRSQPVAVEIGLAGGGKVAHTIEYSMRATGSSPPNPPTTSTTTASESALGKRISAFEALEIRGLGATYTATYSVDSLNTRSTEIVYSSGDGTRLAYRDFNPGQPETDSIAVAGQPAVSCGDGPHNSWLCGADPAPNGWESEQNQAVPWGVKTDVQNYFTAYFDPGPDMSTPVPQVVISQGDVSGNEATCLRAASIPTQPPMSICLSSTGVLLSYSQQGDPSIEITKLSNVVPSGAFVPPATPKES
jgi:hypothetical protein